VKLPRCCAAAILCVVALSRPTLAERSATDEVPLGQSRFRVFAGDDGLRNLVILAIAQDDNGFLWLGTEDGVYRFDGERFTHFSSEDGLSSSLITVIGVAPDGTVYVGTHNGLVAWDGQRFSQARAAGVPAVPVDAIVSFAGKLWIGTEGAGLYVQGADGVFVPAPGWRTRPGTVLRALWADASGLVVGNDATIELSDGNGVWRGYRRRDRARGAGAGVRSVLHDQGRR
jgi:ligand-binding sensor domain-containing protein